MTAPLAPLVIAATALTMAGVVRVAVVDQHYTARRVERLEDDVLGSPGPKILDAVSMEHPLGIADVTWLSIVQELGKGTDVAGGLWDRVERWTDIAVDLDPKYFTIYHSVGVNLSVYAGRVESSDRILLRGYAVLPHRWELPMILGYNAYFVHGDARLGSDYVAEAAALPGAPKFLASLAGRMRYHSGDEEGALALLQEMLLHMEGPARDEIESRIKLLKSEARFRVYDRACRLFVDAKGYYPTTGADVFSAGLVQDPPTDLFDQPITFDSGGCVSRSKVARVREFEAQRRVGSFDRSRTSTLSP